MSESNIYALGFVKINKNVQQPCVVNYVNNKNFTDNAFSLITQKNFNIKCGEFSAFTYDNVTYLFAGGDDNIVYYVVTKNGYPSRVLTQCIQDLEHYYTYYKNKGNKIDMELLTKICNKYNDPTEIDKLAKIQQKVNVIKNVMQQNIDTAMQNCVRLEEIEKQSEELHQMAGIFKKNTTILKKKMWWKDMKMKIIIAVIILTILGVIIGVLVAMSQQNKT